MPSEHDFQEALRARLGSRKDVRLWRQLVGQFYAKRGEDMFTPVRVGPPNGAADLSGIHLGSGRRIEVEVKAEKGRLSDEQERWGKNMLAWGAVYVLAQYDGSMTMQQNVDAVERAVEQQLVRPVSTESR